MSYLNVHYECIQNKQNMTISRWSCPFYLTLTAWRGDGMDEVNLLLPMASPSPPRVLQFALFHPFWARSMAVACPMSSGPVVLVQLNPGFWQHLLSRSPSRDGITSALLLP